MKTYSLQERTDMILIIGECQENCFLASRVYAQKYPNRNHPDKRVFEKLLCRFRATGSVAYTKRHKTTIISEENEFAVLEAVVEEPHNSTRKIAQELDISHMSVFRILEKYNYHPYHLQHHQQLYAGDYDRRVDFCLWALERYAEDSDFFNYVLFTDESTFHNNGLVNRHNFHYYDTENPHLFRTMDRQNRWSLNVFGGIVGNHVIGPYFFNGHLNGSEFLRFLKGDFCTLLENVPLNIRNRMWLQLDGAPAHFKRSVRNYLNRKFPNRWIGRDGPCNWPPRSPDLTCMDFFLWGYVKEITYNIQPTTAEDMQIRIRNAFNSITPNMLRNVRRAFEERVILCLEENGNYVEG